MSTTSPDSAAASRQRPEIAPYTVRDSGRSLDEVRDEVNWSLYHTYSADLTTGSGLAKVVADPLFHYERLLRRLREIPNVRFRTMEDLMTGGHDPSAISVTIRHDVDGDIEVCRPMAELEAAHRIPTTYYILHTAFYYGRFEDGVFLRNSCLGPWYLGLQELGHEISLHTDPLLVYQEHRIDGAAAVREEIAWLRSLGIRVPGTAAHNHTSVYGAQNYEIFSGRVRNFVMPGGSPATQVDEDEVWFGDRWAPLHQLDEAELGLVYEGHDAYAQPGYVGIMAEIRYGTINQTWNVQTDWRERGLRQGPGTFDDLDVALTKLRPGDALIFTTHPLYYGGRLRDRTSPVLRGDEITTTDSGPLAGPTYAPGSLVAVSDHDGERQTGQAINHANELGMLSRPLPAPEAPGDRVLILGGTSVDGRRIGIHDQIECLLEPAVRAARDAAAKGNPPPDHAVHVRTAAWPTNAVGCWARWLPAVESSFRPDVVVLVVPDVPRPARGLRGWLDRRRHGPGGASRPAADDPATVDALRSVLAWLDAEARPVVIATEGHPDSSPADAERLSGLLERPVMDLARRIAEDPRAGVRWRAADGRELASWTVSGHHAAAAALVAPVAAALATGADRSDRRPTTALENGS